MQIKQARDEMNIQSKKSRTDELFPTETVIDGCHVKMRFDPVGDSNIISAIQSMLMSSHMDATLSGRLGSADIVPEYVAQVEHPQAAQSKTIDYALVEKSKNTNDTSLGQSDNISASLLGLPENMNTKLTWQPGGETVG